MQKYQKNFKEKIQAHRAQADRDYDKLNWVSTIDSSLR